MLRSRVLSTTRGRALVLGSLVLVAWLFLQLYDAGSAAAARSRLASSSDVQCPPVGSQTPAQLKSRLESVLASQSLHASARASAYHCYSRALAEAHCRDLGALPVAPEAKVTALKGSPASILVKIDPLPAYLNVYNASEDIVSGHLVRGEGWEQGDIDWIIWALRKCEAMAGKQALSGLRPLKAAQRPVFLDVGANVGAFTMQVAANGFDVLAFEAMPANQHLLRTAMCASHPDIRQRVTLYPLGLSSQPAKCYIVSADNNRGDGILICGVKNEDEARAKALSPLYKVRDSVDIVRGDDLLLRRNIKVIKMDIEGHEPFAVKGMKELFAQQTVMFILLEYNERVLPKPKEGGRMYDFVVELAKLNYRVSRKSFQGPFLQEADMAGVEGADIINLYLTHQDIGIPASR